MKKVSFRGVDLTQQRLPTGDEYLYLPDAAAAIERALAALTAQPPSEHHAEVEWFLREVLGREVAFGQRQLLLRERTTAAPPPTRTFP